MMEIPAPMTPPDSDLRDFAFMPLDVSRLRDSDLAAEATGDEFRAAVLLWCASWHQIPAGSLPNDEKIIAHLCGFGRAPKEWKRIRNGALRGFVLCSDGRLYHPHVAEKVNEAWRGRGKFSEKREKDRERLREWRERKRAPAEDGNLSGNDDETRFGNNGETCTKPLRERQGTVESIPFTNVNGGEPEKSEQPGAPQEPDEVKALWDDAKAYLGTRASGQIGKWVKDHGIPAVRAAIEAAKAENGGHGADNPQAFMATVLRNGAEREAARIKAQNAAEASFNRRFPDRELEDSEARALMEPAEYRAWAARRAAK